MHVRNGGKAEISALARYLYGAHAAGLQITGEVEISVASESPLPALKGYVAGLQDENFEKTSTVIEEVEVTDATGAAKLRIPIAEVSAPHPLAAKIILRVGEPGGGGRAV